MSASRMMLEKKDYWDNYYREQSDSIRLRPSQFAVFVANELSGRNNIIDFGCGNGRDSLYFAHLGHAVIGVDASREAIVKCRKSAGHHNLNVEFLCENAESIDTRQAFNLQGEPLVVYARFFLHALTEAEEDLFFEKIRKIGNEEVTLCLEFRTVKDAGNKKETPNHFRRFLNPYKTLAKLLFGGFSLEYYVEGFGYAKYKDDDAYVARIIASKTPGAA